MEILSKEFQEQVSKDLKLDDLPFNNISNIGLQHQYLQYYIEHKFQLIKLDKMRDGVFKELYDHYRWNFNKELKTNELELYIRADEKFKKINEIVKKKELEVEYLESIVKLFANRSYHIKNALEFEKLKGGI